MRWAIAVLGLALAVPLLLPSVLHPITNLFSSRSMPQPTNTTYDIIVIGGGLAGVTAARAAVDSAPSIKVALLDKQPQLGGNSMKASTGINAVYAPGGDSVADFVADTMASGKQRSDVHLVQRLVVRL